MCTENAVKDDDLFVPLTYMYSCFIRVDIIITDVVTGDGKVLQLSVVVTGCSPIGFDGRVGIHGPRNCSTVLDQLTSIPGCCDCSLTTSKASFSVSNRYANMMILST